MAGESSFFDNSVQLEVAIRRILRAFYYYF